MQRAVRQHAGAAAGGSQRCIHCALTLAGAQRDVDLAHLIRCGIAARRAAGLGVFVCVPVLPSAALQCSAATCVCTTRQLQQHTLAPRPARHTTHGAHRIATATAAYLQSSVRLPGHQLKRFGCPWESSPSHSWTARQHASAV